ncbi:tetratricopeptide repeat protein [Myxococcota bacterium]|nr:tetratricopeptide repeat protein [Myxococcota bacterium]MBU1537238.1 tetratricopeptide repeat protein [Myxococcota bacterium]
MEDLRKLVAQGREAYTNGDYETAEKLLLRVVEIRDNMADVQNMLGVIYSQTGRVEEAKKYFERAIIINPGYTDAALNLSVTYNELGKYDEARKVYTRAMLHSRSQPQELDPFIRGKLANMHADLGEVYRELGMFPEAVHEYQRSLELAGSFIDLRTRLAEIFKDMGEPEKAKLELLSVLDQNPSYVPALIAMGVFHFSQQEFEEASEYFNKVKELNPDNRSSSLYLKMLALQKEKEEGGITTEPVPRILDDNLNLDDDDDNPL